MAERSTGAEVIIPGLNSLRVQDVSLTIARDERNDPAQVLLADAGRSSVLEARIWRRRSRPGCFPQRHPDPDKQKVSRPSHRAGEPLDWSQCQCYGNGTSSTGFDARIIEQSQALP